jgi:hypothetical protein
MRWGANSDANTHADTVADSYTHTDGDSNAATNCAQRPEQSDGDWGFSESDQLDLDRQLE